MQIPKSLTYHQASSGFAFSARGIRTIWFAAVSALLAYPLVLVAATLDGNNIREQDIIYSAEGGGNIATSGTTRTTVLRTNVRIQQGSITIYGDTATLEQNTETGDLIKVTVEGQPARFSRTAAEEDDVIDGESQQIVYYHETVGADLMSVVEFLGDANFTRGRMALQCAEIKHIVESAVTDSPGPCSGVLGATGDSNILVPTQ